MKKFVWFLLAVLVALSVWQFDLLKYGFEQAQGQLRIVWQSKPVAEVLKDPDFPDSLKQKVLFISEVKEFAVNVLGMEGKDNYNSVYDQKGMPALWVVTASPPFELKAYEWSFPILGAFSYKGFFNYNSALKEQALLQERGYETSIRTVNAWSTLGWFDDPVLTSMLYRDEGSLADLIIHELAHATLYVKDSVQFNENLATFIGNKGAEAFLTQKFGAESPEFTAYIERRTDREKFTAYALKGAEHLGDLYDSLVSESDPEAKAARKKAAIDQIRQNLDTVSFAGNRYSGYFDDFSPNNNFFLSHMRYHAELDELDSLYRARFNHDLKAFIHFFKTNYRSL